MKDFLRSNKFVILLTFLMSVIIVVFNVFDITTDKTNERSYTRQEIESKQIELVDINKASISQLCALPHISEKTAVRIVEYREENGDFEKAGDIALVNGISQSKVNELLPFITVK